jgi:hypothetical protein
LDFVAEGVSITRPRCVVIAGKLHVLGTLNILCNITAVLAFDVWITRAGQHERGNRDYWQHMPHIYLHIHL